MQANREGESKRERESKVLVKKHAADLAYDLWKVDEMFDMHLLLKRKIEESPDSKQVRM